MYKTEVWDYKDSPERLKELRKFMESTEFLVLVNEETDQFIIVSDDPYNHTELEEAKKIAAVLNA